MNIEFWLNGPPGQMYFWISCTFFDLRVCISNVLKKKLCFLIYSDFKNHQTLIFNVKNQFCFETSKVQICPQEALLKSEDERRHHGHIHLANSNFLCQFFKCSFPKLSRQMVKWRQISVSDTATANVSKKSFKNRP